jgi:hypothetical protein
VGLGLYREFVVDRVPILGALALQQLERMLPNFVASLTQCHDRIGRERIAADLIPPMLHQRDSSRFRHGL